MKCSISAGCGGTVLFSLVKGFIVVLVAKCCGAAALECTGSPYIQVSGLSEAQQRRGSAVPGEEAATPTLSIPGNARHRRRRAKTQRCGGASPQHGGKQVYSYGTLFLPHCNVIQFRGGAGGCLAEGRAEGSACGMDKISPSRKTIQPIVGEPRLER
ncbi:hypothetical protein E2C01_070827 [Portunus trituberculatus]|uniref:Secreted protein n=1 Tax=Portunus trituberculatus TaxID=210409 RepID=A0A5B7I4N1_PORTR|nr:hypothetical protein [Portunus trituberculatus]